jgi:hypothetical protein
MRKYELILKSNMVSHDRMDNRPIAKQMVTFLVPWHKESCEVLSQRVMWGIITKSHVRYYRHFVSVAIIVFVWEYFIF